MPRPKRHSPSARVSASAPAATPRAAATTWLRYWPLLLVAGAPLYTLIAMLRRETGVPFWDEWEWADAAYRLRTGTFGASTLWTPHNGHHNVLPTLVFALIDRLAGWSPRCEELVGFAALVAAQFALWAVVKRTLPRFRLAAYGVLCSLLYNPAQYESWSMGFNLGWEFCTAAAIALVERLTSGTLTPLVVAQAAALALAASLSSGQGLLLWPLGLALLLARGACQALHARIASCAAWSAVMLLVCIAYFRGDDGAHAAAANAGTLALYVVVFLGNGFGHRQGVGSTALFGALLLALAGTAFAAAWRTRTGPAALLPWAAFGAYGLFAALVTAATRGSLGAIEATSSRYTALAEFLAFAVVGAAALVLAEARAPRLRPAVAIAAVAAAALAFGFVQSALWSDATWRFWEARRAAAAQRIAADDFSAAETLYPDRTRFTVLLDEACRVGDAPIACPARISSGTGAAGAGGRRSSR